MCGLDMVQLHRSEGIETVNWKKIGVPALRVVDIEIGASDDGNGGSKGQMGGLLFSPLPPPTSLHQLTWGD
jgi:hypothetical protein